MQVKKGTDSNPDLLTNVNSKFDSPGDEKYRDDLLPTNDELVTVKPKKKKQFFSVVKGVTVVLVTLIGGAIALPSFISSGCGGHTREAEGRHYLSSTNKAQQAYYTETGKFTDSWDELGVGIKTQTTNYIYLTRATEKAAFSYGISRKQDFKSYVGAVFLVPATSFDPKAAKDEMTTVSILCQAKTQGTTRLEEPTLHNGNPTCGSDSNSF